MTVEKSLKELEGMIALADAPLLSEILRQLATDGRRGAEGLRRKAFRRLRELSRLSRLYRPERLYRARGYRLVAGVDEAGRGPLAGPVVAAAVILPADLLIENLDDSKRLTPQRREEVFARLEEAGIPVGIGMAGPSRIDEINIYQATLEAMKKALAALRPEPEAVLVDGLTVPGLGIHQRPMIKGDRRSASIAAASVVAKVTRDRMMEGYHAEYPGYGFDRNKGYGTPEHIEALKLFGPCPLHRATFIGKITGQVG